MINQDLQQQLLNAFKIEAEERIESMFSTLTELEKSDDPESRPDLLEIVYREAHSMKGAARSVNIIIIEKLCQAMEAIFNKLKSNEMSFSRDLFDYFYDGVGLIEKYLATSESQREDLNDTISDLTILFSDILEGGEVPVAVLPQTSQKELEQLSEEQLPEPEEAEPVETIVVPEQPSLEQTHVDPVEEQSSVMTVQEEKKSPQIKIPIKKESPKPSPAKEQSKPLFSETVRISIKKLDSLLLKTEELISVKQILNQHLNQMKEMSESIWVWKKKWGAVKPELQKIRSLSETHNVLNRFLQIFESNHKEIQGTSNKINELISALELSNRVLGGMVDDLLNETKNTSLLPFSTLFSVLPRMVREIAKDKGKQIDIELSGGDIEIDKRILESIKDPLIHLLRNSVDHGIEKPEAREDSRKPPKGSIHLSVSQPESNKVKIEISDDGHGIDVEKIRAKIVQKGFVSTEDAYKLKDSEIIPLIFQSGISTSPIITDISGHGLGMAIVKENIENLGGLIDIQNAPGKGTTFSIELPVSLATFRGILVSVSGHIFIIPNVNVEHTLKVLPDEIKTVENRTMITVEGQALAIVNLADVLGLPDDADSDNPEKSGDHSLSAVILESGDKRIAFIIDEIINEQEVLVKNLGKQLKRVPNISGATILGTGQVVPILNVNDLIKSSAEKSLPGTMIETIDLIKKEVRKSILIVEDSLTARTLLKNILEASGYIVKTAIDGHDGYNQIKSRPFDAVVSDVEMPRMNGFDLTKKIRGEETLSDLPVILVTNLDSRVDRERGIDAGADAYIVKSNFDRSNLLDVIDRLI